MKLKRVVITGAGAQSPLGRDVPAVIEGLSSSRSAVRHMEGWDADKGLRSHVAAPAETSDIKAIPRQSGRSMGPMSFFSVFAAEEAIADSGIDRDLLSSGRMGCIVGSTMGGAQGINDVFALLAPEKDMSELTSMKFFQCVAHTAALNVTQYLGINGVMLATSGACASGLQAVGAGYDLIRMGRQDIVLCGGAEELHPTVTAAFDVLYATSSGYNDRPEQTPRPFDAARDGLVCGAGAGILVLEELEHARSRGAKIYAEIAGYHTASSGLHISKSSKDVLVKTMRHALGEAQADAGAVDYINAHATATIQGDAEEAQAIREIFSDRVPVSSLKGYMGHTLGASGAIELIASLEMMRQGRIFPTRNLSEPAADCGGIWHVREPLQRKLTTVVKNAFALGGINASIVLRAYSA